jgi:hypothetical protein
MLSPPQTPFSQRAPVAGDEGITFPVCVKKLIVEVGYLTGICVIIVTGMSIIVVSDIQYFILKYPVFRVNFIIFTLFGTPPGGIHLALICSSNLKRPLLIIWLPNRFSKVAVAGVCGPPLIHTYVHTHTIWLPSVKKFEKDGSTRV